MYKLPRLHHGQDEQVREGIAFYYMDSEFPAWSRSKTPINATGHAVEHTLRQIYTHDKSKVRVTLGCVVVACCVGYLLGD